MSEATTWVGGGWVGGVENEDVLLTFLLLSLGDASMMFQVGREVCVGGVGEGGKRESARASPVQKNNVRVKQKHDDAACGSPISLRPRRGAASPATAPTPPSATPLGLVARARGGTPDAPPPPRPPPPRRRPAPPSHPPPPGRPGRGGGTSDAAAVPLQSTPPPTPCAARRARATRRRWRGLPALPSLRARPSCCSPRRRGAGRARGCSESVDSSSPWGARCTTPSFQCRWPRPKKHTRHKAAGDVGVEHAAPSVIATALARRHPPLARQV